MKYELADIMNNHRWFIMGLAMISVVLFHQPWFDWGPFDFFHRTGFYGVEVFLFVSGWGIFQSLSRNPIKIYFKNRIIRMMPTCIIIGIMQAIFCLCGWDNGVNHPLAYIFMCLGLFKWFVYAILLYYTLAPWVYKLLRQDYLFGLFMTIVLVLIFLCRADESFFEGSLLSVIPNILYRFPAFLMGMWLARNPNCFSPLVKVGFLSFILFLLLVYDVYSFHYSVIFNSLVFISSLPFLLSITSIVVDNYIYNVIYRAITIVGMCSLEVYLWHDFFFRGMYNFTENSSILFLVSILATFGAVLFTRRITLIMNNLFHYGK